MKIYKKAILPIGFKAGAVYCGIRKSKKLDLALCYSQVPGKAAGRFTKNRIQAAPVVVDKKHLKAGEKFQALIANSGNANSFTGEAGIGHAEATAHILARTLGIKKESVLVASTGIIGRKLSLEKIKKAIPGLVKSLSRGGINKFKQAIMTTDTFSKEVTAQFNIGSRRVTICGVAKGAGMIAPDMATMLGFILTDANITQRALEKALSICVDGSFNCITVDGCMSTNDSVIILANSASQNSVIDKGKYFSIFVKALNIVCLELAKMIVHDAEGASKFIQIKVKQAKDFNQAKKAALAIANSNLFKTAMYGENPNFGRIASAIGASGIQVDEKGLKIRVSPLSKEKITVEVNLAQGGCEAVIYTSDLTPEYIKINAEYN
jgi:glutamate N-acetyltransferase/amino-acid N-acetyltransferase